MKIAASRTDYDEYARRSNMQWAFGIMLIVEEISVAGDTGSL